jgi:hypothetical protein
MSPYRIAFIDEDS